jgi:hypothetical protein
MQKSGVDDILKYHRTFGDDRTCNVIRAIDITSCLAFNAQCDVLGAPC